MKNYQAICTLPDGYGSTISTVTLNSFWASVGNPSAFDPKILYEPFNNRWIFSAAANSYSTNSALLIGVSQTSDPTGSWNLYSIDVDANNQNWLDYPSIGYNKDWIVVTGTIADISPFPMYQHTNIYVFKKTDLYSHNSSPQMTLISSGEFFGLSPAATLDNNISNLYLLQTYNGNLGGIGYLRLFSISGSINSPTISSGTFISTPNPWNNTAANDGVIGPQLGSSIKIRLNSDNIMNTVYRNGSLWAVHTVFLPAVAPTGSALQWWQVSTSGAILQRGRIDGLSNNAFFGFPSIAVNSSNYALIGYAKFSSSIYPSACYSLRSPSDPVNTFQSEYLYKSGLASSASRYGDYSATMTDPAGLNFWTIQEYPIYPFKTQKLWGTWWAKVSTSWDTCSAILSISANPSVVICLGTSVTFTASPTNSGTSPVYQWKKNGINVGVNSQTYTNNSLTNGDLITCTMTSNQTCATGNPATSNTLTMTVNSVNDGNLCTNDACNVLFGTVTHKQVIVDDGFPCTMDGCNSLTGIFHTSVNCGPTFSSNIILQGFYSGSGLMLTNNGLGCLNNFDEVIHPDFTDADTVFISAMNPTFPFAEVYRQSAILKTNGDITVIFGSSVIAGNYYYIKVNHRNSLETWSALPIQLNPVTFYSFSSSALQSFPPGTGNEAITSDNLYASIYSGDINQDGTIDASDFLEIDPAIQNGDGGYIPTDLNGDATADASDFLIIDPNIQNGYGAITP